MTSKFGRGGGRGQTRLGPPPSQRMMSLGRGMGMKDKPQLSKDGGVGGKGSAAAGSAVTAGTAQEEAFQLRTDGTAAPFAIMVKLTPGLWEEFQRAEAEGSSSSMKFGANPSGHVIKIGSEEYSFSSAKEPGELNDIYEEQQRGEAGDGILVEKGSIWRKVAVHRTLSASEKDRVKQRVVEAERMQKSRKAIVLEHSNSLMKNQVAAANDGGSGRKFMQGKGHSNALHNKESFSSKHKSSSLGASAVGKAKSSPFNAAHSSVGNVKPKLSAPVSPEVITGSTRPLPSVPSATMLPPKARPAVEEIPTASGIPTASAPSRSKVSSPAAPVPTEAVVKVGAALNGTDLRNCLITLLTDNPKGMTMKALERALGDVLPNLQAGRKKNIEKVLKGIATFHAPGKYMLKEGVEKGSLAKPSGNSPDSVPVDSPPLADSPALPDASSDATQDVGFGDDQGNKKETAEVTVNAREMTAGASGAPPSRDGHDSDRLSKEQFQRPSIRRKDVQGKKDDIMPRMGSVVLPEPRQTSSQAYVSPEFRAGATEPNGIAENDMAVDAAPSDVQEAPLKAHAGKTHTPDKSDGSESSSSGGSASDSGSDSESGSDSGSGSDSDSDSSSSSGDDESADEEVHIVSDDENEAPVGPEVGTKHRIKPKEASPSFQPIKDSGMPLWTTSLDKPPTEVRNETAVMTVDEEDVDIGGPMEDEDVDVVSSGGPSSPLLTSLSDIPGHSRSIQKSPQGDFIVPGATLPSTVDLVTSTDVRAESRKERSASDSDNSIEALEMRAENSGARLVGAVSKVGKPPKKDTAEVGKPPKKDTAEVGKPPKKDNAEGTVGKPKKAATGGGKSATKSAKARTVSTADKAAKKSSPQLVLAPPGVVSQPARESSAAVASQSSQTASLADGVRVDSQTLPTQGIQGAKTGVKVQKAGVKAVNGGKKPLKPVQKTKQAPSSVKGKGLPPGEIQQLVSGAELPGKSSDIAAAAREREQPGNIGLDLDARNSDWHGQNKSVLNQDYGYYGRHTRDSELYWKNSREPSLLGKPGKNVEMLSRNGRDQFDGQGMDGNMYGWPNRDLEPWQGREVETSRRNDFADRSLLAADSHGKLDNQRRVHQDGSSNRVPSWTEQPEDSGMLSDGEIKEGDDERSRARSDRESGELDDMVTESSRYVESESQEIVKGGEAFKRTFRTPQGDFRKDSPPKKTATAGKEVQKGESPPRRQEHAVTGKGEPAGSKGVEVQKIEGEGRGLKRMRDDSDQVDLNRPVKKSSSAPAGRANPVGHLRPARAGGGDVLMKPERAAAKQVKPSPDSKQVKPSADSRQAKPSPDSRQAKPSPDLRQVRPSPDSRQVRPSPDSRQVKPSPDSRQVKPSPELRQVKLSPESTGYLGVTDAVKSSPSDGARDLLVVDSKTQAQKSRKPASTVKGVMPDVQNSKAAVADLKANKSSAPVKGSGKRKQPAGEDMKVVTARKKPAVARDSEEDSWFLPYEKKQAELRGEIGTVDEYMKCCKEYNEKYPIYVRLNSVLEADRSNFEGFRKNINLAKSEEDKKKLASIYGALTETYVVNWERFRRMRDTFLALHHELRSIKERVKEFAEKVGQG